MDSFAVHRMALVNEGSPTGIQHRDPLTVNLRHRASFRFDTCLGLVLAPCLVKFRPLLACGGAFCTRLHRTHLCMFPSSLHPWRQVILRVLRLELCRP